MAITTPPSASKLLTYEQYITEGEIVQRYHILDGVRVFMAAPTWQHQRIQMRISLLLGDYEEATGIGYVLTAPFDVLIRRHPLRTRQPDVLFITKVRLEQGGGIPAKGPMEVGPELVVEILSDTERQRDIDEKLADYISIGVQEAWLVHPDTRTVDVVRLASGQPETAASYNETQRLHSITFDDLQVDVSRLFRV